MAIKAAQGLGFRLFEVQKMIQISGKNPKAAQEMRATAAAKVRELDHKIRTLRSGRMALLRLLKTCRCQIGREPCIAVNRFRPEGDFK
jgi:DNA-binding transcriptional MerR regulator